MGWFREGGSGFGVRGGFAVGVLEWFLYGARGGDASGVGY